MVWPRHFFAGWRGLGRFWVAIIALLALTGLTLQLIGAPPALRAPPPGADHAASPEAAHPAGQAQQPAGHQANGPVQAGGPDTHGAPSAQTAAQQRLPKAPPTQRPGRDAPGPIADPDPALLEPVGQSTTDFLPRIASDGRMPMQVYAAGFDGSSRRPRVGLLLAGLGLNQADSEAAVRALPRAVTLAISPYAQNVTKLLSAARSAEHEYLISIPMEPQGFPLSDPGNRALMTNLSLEDNRTRLLWLLSRVSGYVGAVGAEGSLRGERFASQPDELAVVLVELAQRGLLYVDPRPGAAPPPLVWSRSVDIVIDEPPTAADIDDKLAKLATLAKERGSALGFAGTVRPVTIQRLTSWANALAADGMALAPVSALARQPVAQ